MRVDIYQSTTDVAEFVTVPAGRDPASLPLPETAVYENLKQFAMGVDLVTEARAGFNGPQIQIDIHEKGFALHPVAVEVQRMGAPR